MNESRQVTSAKTVILTLSCFCMNAAWIPKLLIEKKCIKKIVKKFHCFLILWQGT